MPWLSPVFEVVDPRADWAGTAGAFCAEPATGLGSKGAASGTLAAASSVGVSTLLSRKRYAVQARTA
jgi:hypothetical protein